MQSLHCIYGYSLVGREDGESDLGVDGESDLGTIIIDVDGGSTCKIRGCADPGDTMPRRRVSDLRDARTEDAQALSDSRCGGGRFTKPLRDSPPAPLWGTLSTSRSGAEEPWRDDATFGEVITVAADEGYSLDGNAHAPTSFEIRCQASGECGPLGQEFERISCDVPNYSFVDSMTLIEATSGESLAQVGSSFASSGDKIEARFGDCVKYTCMKGYHATKEQCADLEGDQQDV